MSTLTLLLIRLAFLAVLWLFVIAAVGVVRTDLFGSSRPGRQRRRQRKAPQVKAPRPARAGRPNRSTPQRPLVTAGGVPGDAVRLAGRQNTICLARDATPV